jgi:hypothetical protein
VLARVRHVVCVRARLDGWHDRRLAAARDRWCATYNKQQVERDETRSLVIAQSAGNHTAQESAEAALADAAKIVGRLRGRVM